jgi:Ca2+/Na+ antiporter
MTAWPLSDYSPSGGTTVAEGWENPSMVWGLLGASLIVILAGSELFTNGIEWIGEGFGLSEGAVGSVLAAVGTALP